MEWNYYSEKFSRKARSFGFSPEQIEDCLRYAKRLHLAKLPVIYNQKHFSLLVGYNLSYLRRVTHHPEGFYRSFKIKKKDGGDRPIEEPLPSLKEVQRWILEEILNRLDISAFAKGFCRKRSVYDNARFHVAQENVISLDIKNFFPSITHVQVYKLFRSLGYSSSVSMMLSKLCSLRDALPQGAPTSPAISNVVFRGLDKIIGDFVLQKKLRYTRYADDLTISGKIKDPGEIISFIDRRLRKSGFEINSNKTRVMGRHERQEVTGVVVNKKMNAPREVRQSIRLAVNYIRLYGIQSHCEKIGWKGSIQSYSQHLLGVANFVRFISGDRRMYREVFSLLKPASEFDRPGLSTDEKTDS